MSRILAQKDDFTGHPNIQALEKADLMLIRNVVNGQSKTATKAFYLEFAVYPLKYPLVIRRLMYLWHLPHRDSSELIKKKHMRYKRPK